MKDFARAILFANADFPEEGLFLLEDDFLVAVDGGLRHLLLLGLTPHLLIGDLDSVTSKDLDSCMQLGVEILRFPPQKDQTDLELAVLEVLQRGFTEIVITCAIGGRLDHTLGNLALLALPELKSSQVCISHGATTIYLVNERLKLPTNPGDLISLLPWGETVVGVTTTGLQYGLSDASLYPWKSRGLSNVATSTFISVSVRSGSLFLFHISKQASIGKDSND